MAQDLLSRLAELPEENRQAFLRTLKDGERQILLDQMAMGEPFDVHLEDYQKIDGEDEASIIMFMAGRGAGKTYKGAAWAAENAEIRFPGVPGLLIAPTFQGVREVMVEGQGSGILDILGDRVENYNRSTYEITTRSGSKIYMRSADRPDSIRGLNLGWCWADEIGAWTRPEAWHEGLMPALRIGERPQVMVTTTPRRVRLVRELYQRYVEGDPTIAFGTAATFDNPHLSQIAKDELLRVYGGTQIGEQELYGRLIDIVIGAIWKAEWLHRADQHQVHADGGMVEVIVGVDPSGSAEGTGDECGIIVAGRSLNGRGYILDDRSVAGSPGEWAARIIEAYHHAYGLDSLNNIGWKPSRVAIEADGNMGGLAKELLQRLDEHIPVELVYTRGKSKEDRARPISMMWERGEIFHLGVFDQLEDQMLGWVPAETKGYSPDRVDALVWAVTTLFPSAGFMQEIPSTNSELAGRGR